MTVATVPDSLIWLILFVVPAVAILLVIFVVWKHQLQQQQIRQLSERLIQLNQRVPDQSAEVAELRSAVIGVGQRLLQLENRLAQLEHHHQAIATEMADLSEHQQKIQLFDPDSRLYSRATKMVQLGAGLEEVMRECELPRAEAELLISLHRQQNS